MVEPKLPSTEQIAAISVYVNLLDEVKMRMEAVEAVLVAHLEPEYGGLFRQRALPGPLAHEFCYLQFRFICELIALGCLVVHGDEISLLSPSCLPSAA